MTQIDPPSTTTPTTTPDDRRPSPSGPLATALTTLGWAAVAAMAAVIAAWISGHDRNPVLIGLIGLMPVIGLPAYAIAGLALVSRRRFLAAAATAIVVAHAAALQPVIGPPGQLVAPSQPTRLFVANVYRDNDRFDEVLARIDELRPEVIVLVEFSAEHRAQFEASPLNDRYPARAMSNDGDYTVGVFAQSGTRRTMINRSDELPALDIDIANSTITVVGVHVTAPKNAELADQWRRGFEGLQRVDGSRNVVLAGDFNATRWHGPYRELVDNGWTDVHDAAGDGLSSSWQPSQLRRLLGPIMRLDHVLTGGRVTAGPPVDVRLPGSDHAGIVIDIGFRADTE